MRGFLKKHYHWIIAAVVLLQMAVYGGSANTLNSVHLIPVTGALGLTRAEFSLGGSIKSMVGVLATMSSGMIMQRFGYKRTVIAGMLLSAACYVCLGTMDSYGTFLAAYAVIGLSVGICGTAGGARIVSGWFHRRRGTILGLVTAATGIGSSILTLTQTAITVQVSWRASYLLVAALLTVVGVLILLLVRDQPEQMGLAPYGAGTVETLKKGRHSSRLWEGFSMKQLIRRPSFYLMILATFLSCTAMYLAFSFILSHLQDRGLTVTQASTINSLMLLGLSGSKFVAGFLCDQLGARKVSVLCTGCVGAGLVLLSFADGFGLSVVAVLVYVLGVPLCTVTIPLLANALFGYKAQTQYTSIFLSMGAAATIISGPISNTVYDRMGSYSPAFLGGAVMAVAAIALYGLLYRLADRDRARMEQSCES